MKSPQILFLLIFIISAFSLHAQTTNQTNKGVFTGKVVNAKNDQPVRVTVIIKGEGIKGKISRTTNSSGFFELKLDNLTKNPHFEFNIPYYQIRSTTSSSSLDAIFNVTPILPIRGQVLDANGQPLKNIHLEIPTTDSTFKIYADAQGIFSFKPSRTLANNIKMNIIAIGTGKRFYNAYNIKDFRLNRKKHARWSKKNNRLSIILPPKEKATVQREAEASRYGDLSIRELKKLFKESSQLQKKYNEAKQKAEELSIKVIQLKQQNKKGEMYADSLETLKEKETKLKERVKLLKEIRDRLEKEKEQYITVIILLITIAVTTFLALYYRNKAFKSKKRSLQEAQRYTAELNIKSQELQSSNTFVQLLLSELNHRVNNNLTSISSKLSIASRRIKDADAKAFLQEVINYVSKLQHIQHNLDFNAAFGNSDHLEKYEIERYFSEMADTIINLQPDLEQKPEVRLDININHLKNDKLRLLGYIAFELINNSCKYAFPEHEIPESPHIFIRLYQQNGHLKLTMGDNGIGMPPELFNEQGVFQLDKVTSSKGLKIIDHLTKTDQGGFNIGFTPTNGASFAGTHFECYFKL